MRKDMKEQFKEAKGHFGGDKYYLDFCDNFMYRYICQNMNCTF